MKLEWTIQSKSNDRWIPQNPCQKNKNFAHFFFLQKCRVKCPYCWSTDFKKFGSARKLSHTSLFSSPSFPYFSLFQQRMMLARNSYKRCVTFWDAIWNKICLEAIFFPNKVLSPTMKVSKQQSTSSQNAPRRSNCRGRLFICLVVPLVGEKR